MGLLPLPLPLPPPRAPLEPSPDAAAETDGPANAALRRLRWRARRGMLENDIVLNRFFDRHAAALAPAAVAVLAGLLELPDGQLLDLVLGQGPLPEALDTAPARELLEMLRAA